MSANSWHERAGIAGRTSQFTGSNQELRGGRVLTVDSAEGLIALVQGARRISVGNSKPTSRAPRSHVVISIRGQTSVAARQGGARLRRSDWLRSSWTAGEANRRRGFSGDAVVRSMRGRGLRFPRQGRDVCARTAALTSISRKRARAEILIATRATIGRRRRAATARAPTRRRVAVTVSGGTSTSLSPTVPVEMRLHG